MNKYTVVLTKTMIFHAEIEVEAVDELVAEDIAKVNVKQEQWEHAETNISAEVYDQSEME